MKKEYVELHKDGYRIAGACVSLDSIAYAFSNIDFQTDTEARPGRGTGK